MTYLYQKRSTRVEIITNAIYDFSLLFLSCELRIIIRPTEIKLSLSYLPFVIVSAQCKGVISGLLFNVLFIEVCKNIMITSDCSTI